MEINTINGHTRILGAPADWDQSKGECEGLPVIDVVTENGMAMVSEWAPTPEEIMLINMNMPIHLWIYGTTHPVVSLSVGQPTAEALANSKPGAAISQNEHEVSLLMVEAIQTIANLQAELKTVTEDRDRLQYQISNESTEADLRMQSMQADHEIALRREEEKGYARGLKDGRTTVEVQDPWEPIETAIEFDEIIVTGYCFGDPEKGRFYNKAKRHDDKFFSTNEYGEEEEIGFLTHWIYTPESHYVKIFSTPKAAPQEATKSIGKLTYTVCTNTALLQKTIKDLLAADELAASAETVDQYRAVLADAMQERFAETLKISEAIALMPRELTAENGAKAALIGEFSEEIEMACPECPDDEIDDECECCNGNGSYQQKVAVDWTTIKAIYAKAVEICEVKELP